MATLQRRAWWDTGNHYCAAVVEIGQTQPKRAFQTFNAWGTETPDLNFHNFSNSE
jgi:hypothetical protein